MNNSNEPSTKLIQSLPSECKQAVAKYGADYQKFLNKYPTLNNRTDEITSVYDAVARGGMSFVSIDRYFQQGASEFWIRIMLIDLFMVIGAIDAATPYQFKAIAQRIRQQYYHLTPSELTRFFYEFSLGDYEEIYLEENESSIISLENGTVDRVGSSLTYGAGIRILKGTESVYGYTSDLTKKSLMELANKLSSRFEGERVITVKEIENQKVKVINKIKNHLDEAKGV